MKRTRAAAAALAALLLAGCAATGELSDSDRDDAAEANFKLGIGYLQSGEFVLARSKLQKALEFDDALVEAHNALGVLYEQAGNGKDAEQEYRQAVEKKPDYLLARLNFARTLCANGKSAEGEAEFLKVAVDEAYPSREIPFTGAGVCARTRNDLEAAEGYFQQALEINPNTPGTLLELASLNVERERFDAARDMLKRYHLQAGYSLISLSLAIQIEEQTGNKKLSDEYRKLLQSQYNPNA